MNDNSGDRDLIDFARLVLAELVSDGRESEKVFQILQHGRTCHLVRSTHLGTLSCSDPSGNTWGYDLTDTGTAAVEDARREFKDHLLS